MQQPNDWIPDVHRTIGALLRDLRRDASLSIVDLAADTGIHHARIGRIERGRTLPRSDEIEVLLDKLSAPPTAREGVRRLATDAQDESIFVPPPFRPDGDTDFVQLQRGAWAAVANVRRFRWLENGLIPGVLQTRGYIEAIFTNSVLRHAHHAGDLDDKIAEATSLRVEAQQMLYDGSREFEFVLPESLFYVTVGTAAVMAGQCYFITQMSLLPNVAIGIIPTETPLPTSAIYPFRIFDEKIVYADSAFGGVALHRARFHLDRFDTTFSQLKELAVFDSAARAILSTHAERFAATAESEQHAVDIRSVATTERQDVTSERTYRHSQ